MKKILLSVLVFILFINISNSQTEDVNYTKKGTYIVGGSSSFSFVNSNSKTKTDTQNIDTGNTLNISLAPAGGCFVIDNLAVGLQLSVGYRKYKDDNSSVVGDAFESKSTTFLALPFVRYYFSKTNIKPFLQASVGIGSSKSEYTNNDPFFESDSENKSNLFTYEFDGGVALFINSNISIDLGVGYASTTSKPKESSSNLKFINNAFGFNAGFNIFL